MMIHVSNPSTYKGKGIRSLRPYCVPGVRAIWTRCTPVSLPAHPKPSYYLSKLDVVSSDWK